ncbi:serine/threonine protein kinase [Rivularia sp. PCC 7116]|uniref:serine/threonine-protein kinase n=1 Tax=Rivularia sp. PCC 7116 TaxID=373994 RepID=UPI00029F49C3|nr:serine/threonine-protein kinase [Rivularia sp. PCC 7116]AFY56809.1 serine/threonine protein kinase [Rivularia sp. PCC 7116]
MNQILSGRYQIIKELGRGGFGVTYIAQDLQRPGNPRCVVKLFEPAAKDPYTLNAGKVLFDREAEALEKLGNHDQIPRLLAHFEESQKFYLVQEFIEGHDLSQELRTTKQLSETFVIELLEDILEVLSFVHQKGKIHRDIKPSNIRRRKSDGKIVLIDFGAVKEVSTQIANPQGQTKITIAIGSPGYMPSEQSNGKPHFSSDIYAVGMIAIQALTGVFPIQTDAQTSEVSWQHLTDVNPKLANILNTMVRYDYRQRYPTAQLALQAIKSLLNSTATFNQAPDTLVTHQPQNTQNTKNILIASAIAGVIAASIAILPNIFNSNNRIEDFSTYQKSNLGITIKFPQNWQRQDIDNFITKEVVAFLSPESGEQDNFQEKVILSVEEYSGSLNQSKDDFTKEITERLSAAKIISTKPTTFAYKPAFQIIYTAKNEESNLNLKNLQIWTLKGNKAYILTYTAEQENYDKFIATVKEMTKSFEIE